MPAARKDFREKNLESLENVMVLPLPLAPSLPACSCGEPVQRRIPRLGASAKALVLVYRDRGKCSPIGGRCAGCASWYKRLGSSSTQWKGNLVQVLIDKKHWD